MKTKNTVDNASYTTTISIGAGKFKQVIWYLVNVFFFKNAYNVFSSIKTGLLKAFGAKLGKGVVIKPSVNIKYPWKLTIGDHSWIGENVWIDNLSEVTIGNHVTISQGGLLITGSHDHTKQGFDFITRPIILEDGVWICAGAIVLGGVTCKSHSILGTHATAEKNLEAYTIYKGNPALPIGERIIN
jgi:putative colanic acid biosynthesis acetyltransferase WcaF